VLGRLRPMRRPRSPRRSVGSGRRSGGTATRSRTSRPRRRRSHELAVARSEGDAHTAATIYTLVGSCQLQGIDPWVYFRDVLGRVLDHPAKRVSELTPKNWLAARQGHTEAGG